MLLIYFSNIIADYNILIIFAVRKNISRILKNNFRHGNTTQTHQTTQQTPQPRAATGTQRPVAQHQRPVVRTRRLPHRSNGRNSDRTPPVNH